MYFLFYIERPWDYVSHASCSDFHYIVFILQRTKSAYLPSDFSHREKNAIKEEIRKVVRRVLPKCVDFVKLCYLKYNFLSIVNVRPQVFTMISNYSFNKLKLKKSYYTMKCIYLLKLKFRFDNSK